MFTEPKHGKGESIYCGAHYMSIRMDVIQMLQKTVPHGMQVQDMILDLAWNRLMCEFYPRDEEPDRAKYHAQIQFRDCYWIVTFYHEEQYQSGKATRRAKLEMAESAC